MRQIFRHTHLGGGLVLIRPELNEDPRGWLAEVYSRDALAREAADVTFVQENRSYTREAGTLRGLHFQRPPHAQAKLFRVLRGRVWNACIDLRPESFGEVYAHELDGGALESLFVPEGFAHGFQSLVDDVEVAYLVSRPFAPIALAGVRWDSTDTRWPLPPRTDLLSSRDAEALPLDAARDAFALRGSGFPPHLPPLTP